VNNPSAGIWTLSTSALTTGDHTISATYTPAANAGFFGSSSTGTNNATIHITGASATTVVTASDGPNNQDNYGEVVSFTATVTPTGSVPLGNGTLTFSDNGSSTALSAWTVTPQGNGQWTLTAPANTFLSAGTHVITATYANDPAFNTSSGTLNPNQVVNKDATSTTLQTNPSGSTGGLYGAIGISAQVTTQIAGLPTPIGSVAFYLNGSSTPFETDSLVSGTATMQNNIPVGTDTITATYLPAVDANNVIDFGGSFANATNSGALTLTITPPATNTALSSNDASNAVYGEQEVVATVTSSSATPTGTVTFYLNGSTTAYETDTLSGGMATLQKVLPVGTDTISATYTPAKGVNGQPLFGKSDTTGTTFTQLVAQDGTTTTVTSSLPGGSLTSQPVTFTAAVTANSPPSTLAVGTLAPTGTVSFQILNSSSVPVTSGISSVTALGNGKYRVTFTPTVADTYTVNATYTPDTAGALNYTGSTSSTAQSTSAVQTVAAAPTITSVTMPSSVISGAAAGGFGVVVQYSNLNAVGQTLTLSLGSKPSTGAKLGVTGVGFLSATVQNVGGVATATFSGLTLNVAGAYKLNATLPGLGAQLVGSISALPNRLVPTFQSIVAPGQKFAFTVAAMDSNGNKVTSFNGKATVSLIGGPTSTLGGVTAMTLVGGATSFTLSLPGATLGSTYTLLLQTVTPAGTLKTTIKFTVVAAGGRRVPTNFGTAINASVTYNY
jgi:hypothetical protein